MANHTNGKASELKMVEGHVHHNGSAVRVTTLGRGISYWRLAMFVFTFIIGVAATLVFQNAVSGEVTTFSTLGLVGFIVALTLSGGAIMLAISSATLGYMAQKNMRERNERSYDLQNEIYLRTVDALHRIESSAAIHTN